MAEHDGQGERDVLSSTFAALADPTRRELLVRLASGEATVNQLAEPFAMSLQAVSKHLKVLEAAGLISRGREGQFRPCRLETTPLKVAVAWIERHRALWEDRYDRLDRRLRELQNPSSPEETEQSEERGTSS